MNPNPKPDAPEETELEGWLSRFQPKPSQRFYQRMEQAPWKKPAQSRLSQPQLHRKLTARLVWGLAILLVVILIGASTLIPPVRAIARQIIYSFIAAPSNQIEVQVTPSSPGDLFNYSDPANFPLSVNQAQSQAGFPILQISPLPDGLALLGARFDSSYDAVILLYQGDQFTLFVTQRPLGNGRDVFSVGTDAVVDSVKVGAVEGEFVRGGWKAISTQTTTGSPTPPSPVNINAIWDNTLPQSTLRWQAGNMAYELRSVGEGGPSQSDLILWANELK